MKPGFIKQLLYNAFFLFTIVCFFTACKKKDFPSRNTTIDTDRAKIDSIAKIDSLPSFNDPAAVAVDAMGNIYVADYGNNLIREITPTGVVTTLAGSGFQGHIDATGNLASFSKPAGIAADAVGNLYIADSGNNLIRKIAPGGIVTTVAGTDSVGSLDTVGRSATFFDPLAVAVDASGSLYVADAGNDLIRKITFPDTAVTTFAGTVNTGTSTVLSPFNNPTGIAVDGNKNVFVTNFLNNTILEVSPAGAISTYAGSGAQGADNGPAASATFYYPNSVAVDAAGNLYISDGVNNLIRKISTGGVVSTLAGSGMPGAIDSTGVNASFNGPAGLAVDVSGNVYVADSNNNLIRKITPDGVVTTIAGNGQEGAKNGTAVARRNKKQLKVTMKRRFTIFYRPKTG